MAHSTPLADAKTVPIAVRIAQRNYPLCTLEPSIALRLDSSCCLSPMLCLSNCRLPLTAPGGRKLRGRRWIGFSEIGSGVAQHRNAAHGDGAYDQGWLEDPAVVEIMLDPDGVDRPACGRFGQLLGAPVCS
jgi:hypothetical protein